MRWIAILVLAGCGRFGFDPSDDFPSGLVAWYPMEDTPSNTADVVSGVNGTCGTVQQCPKQTTGPHGGAFMFDASGDCLEVPDVGQASLQQYTIAIWGLQTVADSCSAFAKRVDVGATVLDSWQIYTSSSNQIELAMNDGNATLSKIVTPDNTLAVGVWHHFAVTVDGSTRTLYYDGMSMGSSPWTTTNYDTHSIWVGCDDQSAGLWSQHWQGALDDFQIYNRALSSSEIMALVSR